MATFLYFDVGGRPYNSQDFLSLQNQLIDITKIYKAYNNGNDYIIEGCTGRGVAGTVWMSGKVRAVQADSLVNNSTPFPVYIVAQDNNVSRVYQDGQAKVAFNVFNAIWSATAPSPGIDFIQFNSQSDLDNLRIISFITPDAVPISGGTYTGPIDAPLVTTGGGIGGNLLKETDTADNGRYRMGLGVNLYYSGGNWISKGDGLRNGSAIITTDIFGSNMSFGIVPSVSGSNRFLTPLDIDNSYKMILGSGGDLTITGPLTSIGATINGTLSIGADMNASGHKIINVANGSNSNDVVNYGQLNSAISTEITNRTNADSAETSARINADNTLQTNINTEITNRTNAVNAEATTRTSNDSSLQAQINTNAAFLVPSGGIIMWSGSPTAIPSGWRLCDGSSGTPDLRGRFIVGYNASDTDYNLVGKIGGNKTHTLTIAEMPAHNHFTHAIGSISGPGGPFYLSTANVAYSGGGGDGFGRSTFPSSSMQTGYAGGSSSATTFGSNTAFDIRPQYYALCYIMKL